MKQKNISIIGSLALMACISAYASSYTEILNETAPVGTSTGPGNGPPTSEGVQADGYVGGHSTLEFALSNNGANQLTVGDVLIYEDAGHTILSDVLRFEDFGVGYVFVYSATDDGPLALADTGMPSQFQANTISFTEQLNGSADGLFGYTPTVGQPGYSTYVMPGDISTTYIYNFTSDEVARAPDGGSTIVLLGCAMLAAGLARRKLS